MTIALASDYSRALFSTGSSAIGEVARQLRKRLAEIQNDFDTTVSLGTGRQESLRRLYEVLEDCGYANWDGYGANAVSFETYEKAKHFIAALPWGLPVPEISADPDGDISFEWYSAPSKVLSVSIGPDNSLNYAGLFGASRTHGTEIFHDEIPQILFSHIRRALS